MDDEPGIVRSLKRVLERQGYDVTTAGDGREALAHLAGQPFDLIVSDIRMPDVDGLTLLRAVRTRDLELPVIFLTGSPEVSTAIQALEYGAFRYLVKPVRPGDLLDAVARAVRWRQLGAVRREVAEEVQSQAALDRADLQSRFTSALQGLWMAMQPIVSSANRRVVAYEALLRTDEATLLNPERLLHAAERLQRTQELGRAIRTLVARAMADAPASARVFVNLHPSDFSDPELTDPNGALTPFADRIVLEVTERAAFDRIPGLAVCLPRLRALGFRLALDDLGAGYAGLTSFAWLEPDVVKVDMGLVRGIDGSMVKQKLFRSIATLCDDLRVDLVAEGIETAAERACLATLGGDLFQGFLFARPDRGFPSPSYG